MNENPEQTAITIDSCGNEFESLPNNGLENLKICAKVITDNITDTSTYFIKIHYNGILYDPFAHLQSFGNRRVNNWKFKKVNKEIFDIYRKYLDTHNKLYFVHASRSIYGGA